MSSAWQSCSAWSRMPMGNPDLAAYGAIVIWCVLLYLVYSTWTS